MNAEKGAVCAEKDRRLVKVLGRRGFLAVSGSGDERIAAIAGTQRGRGSRAQLRAAGVSQGQVARRLRRGLLRREHAGVYTVISGESIYLGRETAALLACGERAVLSHASAAAVWGIAEYSAGPVEVTVVASDRGKQRQGVRAHRAAKLLDDEIAVHQHLPITSPARTLIDRAGQLSPRDLERELDEASVVLELVTRSQLRAAIERAPRRKGVQVLAKLLDRRGSAITRSEAEERFLKLVRGAGLPAPQTQVKIGAYTVDFFWPAHRVAFEIDGFRFHTSRRAFDRDRRKEPALKAAGVDPNRVSRDQVRYEPFAVVAYVASALARADVAFAAQPSPHRPGTTPNSSVPPKPISAPAAAMPLSRASCATAPATPATTSRLNTDGMM